MEIQEILDEMKVLGDGKYEFGIAQTIQEISNQGEEIAQEILDEIVFIFNENEGTCENLNKVIPSDKTGYDIALVIFNFVRMIRDGKNESQIKDAIAHEIAHVLLGHHNRTGDDNNAKTDEIAADDLIASWGFNRVYSDYSIFDSEEETTWI